MVFAAAGFILGEAIARTFFLTSDIPQRTITKNGIQKYKPNQEGYWLEGSHKWHINELGWPGTPPESYKNLVAIIGDSYIENFMNPEKCHQSQLLKELAPKNNYLEAARSGVSLVEAFKISEEVDSLRPQKTLIYVHDSDFIESISAINRESVLTQVDLKEGKILPGKLKSPGLKYLLYNIKFLYYLYNRILLEPPEEPIEKKKKVISKTNFELCRQLLSFISENFNTDNKVLVFRPNSEPAIINLSREMGFNVLQLRGDNSWSFEHDSHWTCEGHYKAAIQVRDILLNP